LFVVVLAWSRTAMKPLKVEDDLKLFETGRRCESRVPFRVSMNTVFHCPFHCRVTTLTRKSCVTTTWSRAVVVTTKVQNKLEIFEA
jgi:hypothetical protein